MGGSDHDFSRLESKIPKELELEIQASKRRKVVEKTVVAVKIEASDHGRQKSSEDCWSWRKYGQKPIKGSPFPRGYYKCSTSKGCSAKKQVERCKTDSSMLIITYTSTHNHPDHPNDLPPTDLGAQQTKEPKTQTINIIEQEEQDHEPAEESHHDHTMTSDIRHSTSSHHFHYSQSPFNSSDDQDMIINSSNIQDLENMTYESPSVFFDEQPPNISCSQLITSFSTPESSEENDFYDELEELPTSSFFTSFMRRTNFFDERILIHPS